MVLAGPVFAYDDPKAMLEAFYAPYLANDLDAVVDGDRAFESVGLLYLIDADRADAGGEIGRLDFDPFISGQDWQTTTVSVGEPDIVGGTARVAVDYDNFGEMHHAVYALVLERDGWKIDDVTYPGEEGFSLRELLTSPFP